MWLIFITDKPCRLILWMEKPVGKRGLGRPRHRWEDNIQVELGSVVIV
jgi:hypothetical protein